MKLPKLRSQMSVRPCIVVGNKKMISPISATRYIAERIVARYFHKHLLSWYASENYTLRARLMTRAKRRIKPYVTKILTGSYS